MEPEPKPIITIVYSSYTPSQKRATQKYRENNKEKVNEQRKKYYEQRKLRDPNFLIYKRNKAKEYYQNKKALEPIIEAKIEETIINTLNDIPIEEIPKVEEIPQNIVVEPYIDESKPVVSLVQQQIEKIEKRRKNIKQAKILSS